MVWFFAVLVVLLIGAIVVVAAGHGESLAPATDDRPDLQLRPDGLLTADDLRRIRFTTAVRGYRADEVDALLERLAWELHQRERWADEGDQPDS
ncbi:MAG: DivIVA domain-containing protein [Marmoricola sp.]